MFSNGMTFFVVSKNVSCQSKPIIPKSRRHLWDRLNVPFKPKSL